MSSLLTGSSNQSTPRSSSVGADPTGLPDGIAAVGVDHQLDRRRRRVPSRPDPVQVTVDVGAPGFADLDLDRGAADRLPPLDLLSELARR